MLSQFDQVSCTAGRTLSLNLDLAASLVQAVLGRDFEMNY